jgi:hypothetical protein
MINGNLKSLQLLWLDLARNQRYRSLVTEEDCNLFIMRSTNEGLSFLTSGLPSIGKALDGYHASNTWDCPLAFESEEREVLEWDDVELFYFETTKRIPKFLGNAIKAALCGNPTAVDCVRQLSYIFYKLEVKFDEELIVKFLDNFIEVDRSLGDVTFDDDDSYKSRLIKRMRGLICRILSNEDPLDITPSHGSGATACRTPNSQKYHKLRYYTKLDDVFSYDEYFFFSPTHLVDEYEKLENASIELPKARVCLVPKDSRGPRVISCEPAELMYIQQGLMRKLYRIIEHHPLTRGSVNFSDQTVNRSMAELGSVTGTLATLDLSDASDRVSLNLIRAVFPPNWVRALEASRSETTLLPDGREVQLNKFAPMGSSCCFPVEALVFWACARAVISEANQVVLSLKRKVFDGCFVYGDDIITDRYFAASVIDGLETIGLKVNRSKSYLRGPFRESCGGDYYRGVDVTPVRLRKYLGTSSSNFQTTADFFNNLVEKFGYDVAHSTIAHQERRLDYTYPRTLLDLPGSIRTSPCASNDVFFKRRWNTSLQRFEHRILSVVSKVKQHHPPNWGELFRKQLCKRNVEMPSRYENWLAIADSVLEPGHYTDPHSVVQKWVWVWLG